MIPINRRERCPVPGHLPPDAVGFGGEKVTDDHVDAPNVYDALKTALGEASGALVFELLKRLAADAAKELGGGIPCISFNDELGQFASIVADGEEEIIEEGEAEPGSEGEWEAGE